MWDESIPSVDDEEEPTADEPDTPEQTSWTDGQLMRLENEFRKAQRSFAYHPVIGILPLRGDPPYEYQLTYRLRTLATTDDGQLQYIDEVAMHIWLPPGFPNQPPVVRPLAAVFHPNVAWEGVYLTRAWQPTDTLVVFAARIGDLLAYRSYDPESVVNSVAMEWLSQNSGALPLDTHADFSPFNGGEPLGRIQKMGPASLEQVRRALDDMRFALLAENGAPTLEEVKDFATQTRGAVSLFLENDIPDNLRQQASEFHDWCRELPDSVPWWEYLRTQRTHASSAEFAASSLRNAAISFKAALDELENLVPQISAIAPATAIKLIPSMDRLEPLQLKLPPLAREFEKWSMECRKLIASMKATRPQVMINEDASLGRRLASQEESVNEAVNAASKSAQEALVEVEPIYKRVRPEISALEQVVGWREYIDMFSNARALEKQLVEWTSDGVQAFYLDNASGSFGPFQFEEPLDLGETRVVVRSGGQGQIEVIDAVGLAVLGRGTAGTVAVTLGKSNDNPGYETTFRLSDRCDELLVKIGFIQQQTVDALSRLQRPVEGATSWCGKISVLLADAQQQQKLREAHRKAAHRWKCVITDLVSLSKFKERLATYHLVQRMSEEVPRILDLIKKAHARHAESTQKIAAIMSKSSRDMESDRLLVPPKLAGAYSDELHAREQSQHESTRLRGVLKQIARDLAARLSTSRLCGRPEIPAFLALPALSEGLMALADVMTDEALQQMLASLNQWLGVSLPFNPPPAPVVKHIARPAEPGRHVPHQRPPRPAMPNAPVAEGEQEAAAESEVAYAQPAEEELAAEQHTEPQAAPNEPAPSEHEYAHEPAAGHSFDFSSEEETQPVEDEIIEGF